MRRTPSQQQPAWTDQPGLELEADLGARVPRDKIAGLVVWRRAGRPGRGVRPGGVQGQGGEWGTGPGEGCGQGAGRWKEKRGPLEFWDLDPVQWEGWAEAGRRRVGREGPLCTRRRPRAHLWVLSGLRPLSAQVGRGDIGVKELGVWQAE